MIRDAVIHLLNEHPLLADLPDLPVPGDSVLVCTNLRKTDRARPFFVDDSASTFVFPYTQIRFVELPAQAAAAPGPPALPAEVGASGAPEEARREVESDDLELDEDLLRRVREL